MIFNHQTEEIAFSSQARAKECHGYRIRVLILVLLPLWPQISKGSYSSTHPSFNKYHEALTLSTATLQAFILNISHGKEKWAMKCEVTIPQLFWFLRTPKLTFFLPLPPACNSCYHFKSGYCVAFFVWGIIHWVLTIALQRMAMIILIS